MNISTNAVNTNSFSPEREKNMDIKMENDNFPPETTIDAEFVERLRLFMAGKLTWAQVEGWTAQTSYRFAVLGVELMKAGKLDDARKVFSSLHAINPEDWYFPYSWSQVERLAGNHDKAFSLLDISIELEPELGEPWLLKGICQLEKGLNEEAAKSLIMARDLGKKAEDVKSNDSMVPLAEALLERLKKIHSNI